MHVENIISPAGIPMGGSISDVGLDIQWQNGTLDECGRNGAFVEDVIEAAIIRLTHFQSSRFACDENELALSHLKKAKIALIERTSRRTKEGTEGTYIGS